MTMTMALSKRRVFFAGLALSCAGALLAFSPGSGRTEPAPAAGASGPSPEVSPDSLMMVPWQVGERRVYIIYYASRKHRKRKITSDCVWDEAVAAEIIHGFRTLVIRSSKCRMHRVDGEWTYSEPERPFEERIHFLTSQGVVSGSKLWMTGGSSEQFRKLRLSVLGQLRAMPEDRFLGSFEEFLAPFPMTPGRRRRKPDSKGTFVKVLRGGSKVFVGRRFHSSAVGAASFRDGKWEGTRWFVRGEGMVTHETHHSDPGVDAEMYPFRVKALALQQPRRPLEIGPGNGTPPAEKN